MTSLAERVEAAMGADRELDALIWCALNGKRYKGHFRAWQSADIQVEFTEPPRRARCVTDGRSIPHAKPYTASIDAAMTLVPEGCGWIAGWGQILPDEPMGGARISRNARFIGHHENYDVIAEAEAATPALALCAAALRARAAMEAGNG